LTATMRAVAALAWRYRSPLGLPQAFEERIRLRAMRTAGIRLAIL
jgi:hypothetical protein